MRDGKTVLVACETSGKVRNAFRGAYKRLGIKAQVYSCDLLPADDGDMDHFQGDVYDAMAYMPRWDLIVMHPPCTALCVSGNRHYGEGKPKHDERLASIAWTTQLWLDARECADAVAMENPIGVLPFQASQVIQPWQFGHGETKATCLWLHNLPLLRPTHIVEGRVDRIHKLPPSSDRWKIRSETYQGIADAMADQWAQPREYQLCLA